MASKLKVNELNSNTGKISVVGTDLLDLSNSTDGIILPSGPTSSEGTPESNAIRFDTTDNKLKVYPSVGGWKEVIDDNNIFASRKTSIIRDNLVVYLDAGNPSSYPGFGTTWTDLSGNENNGTLVNDVSYTDTFGGLIFDQTNDWVIFDDTISVTNNYTISYVTLPTDFGSNAHQQWLFDRGGGSSGVTLYGYNSGKVGIRDSSNGQRYLWNVDYRSEIYNKLWFMDFVCETNQIKLYLNAVDRGNITPASTAFNINYISTNRTSDDQVYGGIIYSVIIYNRALFPQEIQRNYNALRSRYIN